MLPQKGDTISIRFHDDPNEQEIIGKDLEVISNHNGNSPYWVDVFYNGNTYSVRGGESIIKEKKNA